MVSKIKEIFKTLLFVILFVVGQYLIMFLFMLFYMIMNSTTNINDLNYIDSVTNWINKNSLLILLVQCIIFIPLFYKKYIKYKCNSINFNFKEILLFSFGGFSLSCILNLIIIWLKSIMNIKMISNPITFTVIIGTGIIGPMLEELLFRGIVYEKFIKIFNHRLAFFLSVFIFAILHTGGIFQILFAFIIGCYLTYIYSRYHDIKLAIIVHIVVNMTSILVSPLILNLF